MQQEPMQEMAQKVASATTYIGSGGAVVFGLTANEIAALIGAAVAVLGFAANIWFRWQHLRVVRQAAIDRPDCATCPERQI